MSDGSDILQLKIRLLGISPMVWRRVLASAETTLQELHGIFQVSMGWEGVHLYQFVIHAGYYGSFELCVQSPKKKLGEFGLRPNDRFTYIYDMGDYWEHNIRVEMIDAAEDRKTYPICTGGAGACPPEDCGGVMGYLERSDEAHGYDAWQDMGTMIEWFDSVNNKESAQKPVSKLLQGDAVAAVERMVESDPFLRDDFSRKDVNKAFRDGEHLNLMHQQY